MLKVEKHTKHYLSDVLVSIVKQYKIKSYLEVGVNEGRSLSAVIENNPHLENLYLADSWERRQGGKGRGNHKHIEDLLIKLNYKGNVVFLDGRSQKTIPEYIAKNPDWRVDLANVDGDHRPKPAREDLKNIFPVADIVVFDDIHHKTHGYLDKLWDEELALQDVKWTEKYPRSNGVAVAVLRE